MRYSERKREGARREKEQFLIESTNENQKAKKERGLSTTPSEGLDLIFKKGIR